MAWYQSGHRKFHLFFLLFQPRPRFCHCSGLRLFLLEGASFCCGSCGCSVLGAVSWLLQAGTLKLCNSSNFCYARSTLLALLWANTFANAGHLVFGAALRSIMEWLLRQRKPVQKSVDTGQANHVLSPFLEGKSAPHTGLSKARDPIFKPISNFISQRLQRCTLHKCV